MYLDLDFFKFTWLGPNFWFFWFLFSLIIGLKPPILDPWSIEPGPSCKLGLSFIIIGHLMYLAHTVLKTHQCQNGKKKKVFCTNVARAQVSWQVVSEIFSKIKCCALFCPKNSWHLIEGCASMAMDYPERPNAQAPWLMAGFGLTWPTIPWHFDLLLGICLNPSMAPLLNKKQPIWPLIQTWEWVK